MILFLLLVIVFLLVLALTGHEIIQSGKLMPSRAATKDAFDKQRLG